MNLILFEPQETAAPLARTDPRAVHVLDVLRRQVGDSFDVGLIDGPKGKGQVIEITDKFIAFSFTWGMPSPPIDPITLIVGLPRPQTARKILQEATTLGVAEMSFVLTERGDPSYAQSTLWSSGEWRRHLISGAEQAFCTLLPAVRWTERLPEAIAALPRDVGRVALDNYEGTLPLLSYPKAGDAKLPGKFALVIGGERGWTADERKLLRQQNFTLAHLGPRVLRTETAVVAGLAILKAKLGLI